MKSPYLYLEEIHYTETWVNGGIVPIKLASSYKSDERKGVYTPDENLVDTLTVPINCKESSIYADDRSGTTFINCYDNGRYLDGERFYIDGLILSFCTKFCMNIMQRLGKKVCIQISDIFTLKQLLDKQLGCVGKYQKCKYTSTHNLDYFLKSKADEWQQEWRIFWDKKDVDKVLVEIPKNTAKLIFPKKC